WPSSQSMGARGRPSPRRWPRRSTAFIFRDPRGAMLLHSPHPEEGPRFRLLSSIDGGLVLAALLLAALGLATVHSASSELPVDYFPRQAAWVAVGLVLMVAAMSLDYHVLLDFSVVLYVLGIVSLFAVKMAGVVRGGAANWLQIGPWQFQP